MFKKVLPLILAASFVVNIFLAVFIYQKLNPVIQPTNTVKPTVVVKNNGEDKTIFEEINPGAGFEINATFGDLGPKMITNGVIDYTKFKEAYQKSGQLLPADLDTILTKGSTQKIKINADNSYFLLNFFWAVGLNNKSKILTAGDMVKYGGEKDLENFASTGGWTLARGDAMNYYSKANLISLTPQMEGLVQTVAASIYRPCCNNPTSFPDCNHGMALLGVLELMAANGANQDQMFEAAKYFNAYWFPGNYYDLAMYFKNKEGKNYKDIDARLILSKEYSSASGYQTIKRWLIDNGLAKEPPKSGRGCGT